MEAKVEPARNLSNLELFQIYDNEILLRLHKPRNLQDTSRLLYRLQDYLGSYPQSASIKKEALGMKIH